MNKEKLSKIYMCQAKSSWKQIILVKIEDYSIDERHYPSNTCGSPCAHYHCTEIEDNISKKKKKDI